MRIPFQFVKAMVIGGLFFLVPFALIIVAVEKLIVVLRPAASKAAALFNPLGIGPGWEIAIVVVTLLLTCLVAGLFGMTVAGRGLFGLMEATLLNRVPGYSIVKGAAADAAGNLSHIESTGRSNAVFVRDGEAWQIGFVMDRIGEDMTAIFVPDAPSPSSGIVLFVGSDQFVDSGLKVTDALRCLRQLGAGSSRMFSPRSPSPA